MTDGDREWVYVYEVICSLRHKPARRCSDYSKKTLIWKLRKRFLKQEESPR